MVKLPEAYCELKKKGGDAMVGVQRVIGSLIAFGLEEEKLVNFAHNEKVMLSP